MPTDFSPESCPLIARLPLDSPITESFVYRYFSENIFKSEIHLERGVQVPTVTRTEKIVKTTPVIVPSKMSDTLKYIVYFLYRFLSTFLEQKLPIFAFYSDFIPIIAGFT